MQINIPRIVRPLNLADYAPEYAGAVIQVWVNPPRGRLTEYVGYLETVSAANKVIADYDTLSDPGGDEYASAEVAAQSLASTSELLIRWMAEAWSQGPPDSHWTADEIRQLIDKSVDDDPGLYPWLISSTLWMIRDYRSGQKKVLRRP